MYFQFYFELKIGHIVGLLFKCDMLPSEFMGIIELYIIYMNLTVSKICILYIFTFAAVFKKYYRIGMTCFCDIFRYLSFQIAPRFSSFVENQKLILTEMAYFSIGGEKKNKEEREQRFREPELAQGVNGTDAPMVPSSPLSSFERLKEIFMLNKSNCHTFRPPQS